MAAIDGSWDTVARTPLGDQKATLTVATAGNRWAGGFVGAMGSVEVTNGTVDGETITWSMNITVPMPMALTCTATADGDVLTGAITAGAFGSFPMTGTRVG